MKVDRKGYSPGFEVRDAKGMKWDVKTGPEAQTEMVTSRILWALGYHQPPIYYLPTWTLAGGDQGTHSGGRFRPALPDRKVVGDWSWYENEFVDSMPFKGLVVANMVLNNWDWKTSNNKIYEVHNADGTTTRQYVVRDVGASLGKTNFPAALRWTPARDLVRARGTTSRVRSAGIHQRRRRFARRIRLSRHPPGFGQDRDGGAGGLGLPADGARLRTRNATTRSAPAVTQTTCADGDVAKLKSKIAEGLALQGS